MTAASPGWGLAVGLGSVAVCLAAGCGKSNSGDERRRDGNGGAPTGGTSPGGTSPGGGTATGGSAGTGTGGTAGDPGTTGGTAGASAGSGGTAPTGGSGGDAGAPGGMGGEDDGGTGGGGGDDGPVGPPSCVGLAHECGPDGATDCCASDVVPEFVGPTRTIFSFELDRYEVTVGRFRKFLAAFDMGWRPTAGSGTDANNPQDRGWSWTLADDLRPRLTGTDLGPPTWTDAPGDNENRPLTRLDWNVAFAFCIWDGGRLPTQEEWRYVATGGESRVYPWSVPPTSRTIDQSYAVYDCMADGTMGCAITDILVVGSRPMGNGRFGQSDLSGSVWEWMRDLAPNQMPDRANGCGGGFFDVADAVTSTFCYAPPPRAVSGGRCARNIPR